MVWHPLHHSPRGCAWAVVLCGAGAGRGKVAMGQVEDRLEWDRFKSAQRQIRNGISEAMPSTGGALVLNLTCPPVAEQTHTSKGDDIGLSMSRGTQA